MKVFADCVGAYPGEDYTTDRIDTDASTQFMLGPSYLSRRLLGRSACSSGRQTKNCYVVRNRYADCPRPSPPSRDESKL